MRTSSCTGKHSEPTRSPDGSGVNREVHAPFCERPEVKSLRPTHPAISTNMARRYGWAPRGKRCRASVPFGHRKTTTLIAALRCDRIDAPMTIDGALDGDSFLAYVRQVLAPALSAGETVLMDNVPMHKVAGVREAIEAKGAGVLYLPAYSPDFNPIEKSFSKIKSILERIAARTAETLETAVGEALQSFTPQECMNYFASSGYDAA